MKMKHHLFATFIAFLSLISLGFANWIVDFSYEMKAKHTSAVSVAYVKEYKADGKTLDGTIYFTSLDGALNYAYNSAFKDEIYVLPKNTQVSDDDGVVIDGRFALSNCYTINSNDSLILPYSNETVTETISNHPSLGYESGSRRNLVKLKSNLTIKNEGTIIIGGVQNSGNGGNTLNGNTTDKYSEFHLSKNSKIINANGSRLKCYGYISGDLDNGNPMGSVEFEGGSECDAFFTIVEHRGGQRYLGMSTTDDKMKSMLASAVFGGAKANLTCFVFNRYFVDNFLNVKFSFGYNSLLNGNGCLFADGSDHAAVVKLIGNTDAYLLNISEKSKIEGWYDKTSKKMKLESYGSFKLNSIGMNLELKQGSITAKVSISSEKVLLPIPYYYSITNRLNDEGKGTITATSQGFKLLPGSSLVVEDGVTLDAKEIAVYPNSFFYPDGKTSIEVEKDTSATSRGIGSSSYPLKQDAHFEVNGILSANSLGGYVSIDDSAKNSSKLNIKNNSLSSAELTNTKDNSVKVLWKTLNYKSAIYTTKTLNAIGKIKNADALEADSQFAINKDYFGKTGWRES